MARINWLAFREIYFKILVSILVVIAAMLLLQDALNHLKLRALVAEATSSRLQISASTIESAIVRSEGLGLSMDEMAGLQDLLDRERERDPSVVQIEIVSPIGAPVVSSGSGPLVPTGTDLAEDIEKEREQALRRVLGARDKVTLFDAGSHLYTGRVIYDSSDAIMGAIILTTPTVAYMQRANLASEKMRKSYLIVFAIVAALLIPFIVVQFSGVRYAFRAFDPDLVGKGVSNGDDFPPETRELLASIEMGNSQYSKSSEELDDILKHDAAGMSDEQAALGKKV